jgi:hypothetical protein
VIAPVNTTLRDRIRSIIVIFCTGLVAEFILPWAVIWLSDTFSFDIPGWSLWLLFGGPPALSLLAMLSHWALQRCSKQPLRAWDHELQGRKPDFRGLQGDADHLGPGGGTTDC